jgi:hypothetical protein
MRERGEADGIRERVGGHLVPAAVIA